MGAAQVHAKQIEEAIDTCHGIEIKKITVHPPILTAETRKIEGKRVLKQFEHLLVRAKDRPH